MTPAAPPAQPTGPALADARSWVRAGTELVTGLIAGRPTGRSALDEVGYAAPSTLPGWTRKHLVAHLAANAEAVGNLVHWAATGRPTPMYSSPEQRAADIDAGSRRSARELTEWFTASAARLESAMDALTPEQWAAEVVTAQGRTVPASTAPWLRAREVLVHAVDLDLGLGFGDLPADFLAALRDDIVAKRGQVPAVDGPLAERVAWLAGRPHAVTEAPDLGPWL